MSRATAITGAIVRKAQIQALPVTPAKNVTFALEGANFATAVARVGVSDLGHTSTPPRVEACSTIVRGARATLPVIQAPLPAGERAPFRLRA